MLQPLAGRVKWEITSEGIRIVIPSRFDIGPLGDTLLVACVPVLAVDVITKIDKQWRGWGWPEMTLLLVAVAVLRIGAILVDRTVLTVNSAWLTIRRGPFGIHWKKTTFAVRRLSNLCAVPSKSDWTGKKLRGRATVQVDDGENTLELAKQLAPAEAEALIDRLREVHGFSGELAAE
jgi:hypothetical protein